MKKLRCFYCFLFVFFGIFFFTGCNGICLDCEGGDGRDNLYSLVNQTNDLLLYEIYYTYYDGVDYDEPQYFDTTLIPNDTLFLYIKDLVIPSAPFPVKEYVPFCGFSEITIKTGDGRVLFHKTEYDNCGEEYFIKDKIDDNKYWHKLYWTIDSEYIADKSCMATYD